MAKSRKGHQVPAVVQKRPRNKQAKHVRRPVQILMTRGDLVSMEICPSVSSVGCGSRITCDAAEEGTTEHLTARRAYIFLAWWMHLNTPVQYQPVWN